MTEEYRYKSLWNQSSVEHLKNIFSLILEKDFQIKEFFFSDPKDINNFCSFKITDQEWLFIENSSNLENAKNYIEEFIHEYQWWLKIDQIKSLLYIDDLTGLFNYKYLQETLFKEIKRSCRYKKKFSILFVDVDHFKSINDEYGHLVGSLVLQQLAQALKSQLREIDSIVRYGGDEFVVLLLEADSNQALIVAHRLRNIIKKITFGPKDIHIKVSISVGVSSYPEHGEDSLILLQKADEGMYKSKKQGRDKVSLAVDYTL